MIRKSKGNTEKPKLAPNANEHEHGTKKVRYATRPGSDRNECNGPHLSESTKAEC